MPRHRHQEFIRFLKKIDVETPSGLDLHIIATTTRPTSIRVSILAEKKSAIPSALHPNVSSWVNMVERWFREITDKRIRRGIFKNVPQLIAAIQEYLDNHNQNPASLRGLRPLNRFWPRSPM